MNQGRQVDDKWHAMSKWSTRLKVANRSVDAKHAFGPVRSERWRHGQKTSLLQTFKLLSQGDKRNQRVLPPVAPIGYEVPIPIGCKTTGRSLSNKWVTLDEISGELEPDYQCSTWPVVFVWRKIVKWTHQESMEISASQVATDEQIQLGSYSSYANLQPKTRR